MTTQQTITLQCPSNASIAILRRPNKIPRSVKFSVDIDTGLEFSSFESLSFSKGSVTNFTMTEEIGTFTSYDYQLVDNGIDLTWWITNLSPNPFSASLTLLVDVSLQSEIT